MNIYVYQIGDSEFGATMAPEFPGGGRVVETWPINNKKEIDFVAKHGSAFGDVTDKVHELADKAAEMLKQGKVYTLEEQRDLFSQKELKKLSDRLEQQEHKLEARTGRLRERESKFSAAKAKFSTYANRRNKEIRSAIESSKQQLQKLDSQQQAIEQQQTDIDELQQDIDNRLDNLISNEKQLLLRQTEWQKFCFDEQVKIDKAKLDISEQRQSLDDAWLLLQQESDKRRDKLDRFAAQQQRTRELFRLRDGFLITHEQKLEDHRRFIKHHPIRAGLRMIFRRKL